MVPLEYYLVLAAFVFVIGSVGVLTRRNVIMILLSIELMLNAVNLTFITFAKMNANMMGQMFVIFVITVAAVEAAVGLALIISLNRRKATLNVDEINILKW